MRRELRMRDVMGVVGYWDCKCTKHDRTGQLIDFTRFIPNGRTACKLCGAKRPKKPRQFKGRLVYC